jgi:ribosome recycling factor
MLRVAKKRETAQIFDLIFKQLIRLSNAAVINFINGLFGINLPLDSTVEYPNTENVSKKLRRLMSDTIVIIGGIHVFHIEAEIGDDENIVVRVFEYGFMEGLRTKTVSKDGSRISMKFPNARIIYWETTKKTPDEVTLSLEFSDGGNYDYKVKTFKFLDHSVDELEKGKLAILLPFYVLKLRKRVVRAKTSERRAELAGEMKSILEELVAAVDRAERAGSMSEADERIVLEHMNRLYRELFAQYAELKEADVMLQDRILTYSEEAAIKAAKEARKEARKEVAKKMKKAAEAAKKAVEKAKKEAETAELKKSFDVAKRMLERGMELSEIAEIVELPVDKLQTLLPNS